MKKTLHLAIACILMLGTASHSLAADIVIKQVKIKKRNVRLAPPAPGYTYSPWADCNEMTITKTTSDNEDQTTFTFSTTIIPGKDDVMATSIMEITVMDCNLKTTTKTLTLKADKGNNYSATISLPATKGCALTLTAADITVTSTGNQIAPFEAELDKTTSPGTDCNGNAKLKSVDFTTDNVSGFYVMSFSMAFEKELPAGATMIVLLTNCKGENAKVPVKLAYDPATGIAMGSTGIMQTKDCPWTLTYGEVYSIDPCGTESTWAVDFGQIKTNGTGTRSGANTVKTSKPKLK